jgi:hypothetical protein
MTETTITNVSEGRSGIGCAPLTVSVLNYDPTLGCDSATFQPCSDRALSSLKVVGDAFKELFPINKDLRGQFPFFGFFLEDQLYGGQVRHETFVFFSIFLNALNYSRPGAILCVVQCRRTDLRRTRNLGQAR